MRTSCLYWDKVFAFRINCAIMKYNKNGGEYQRFLNEKAGKSVEKEVTWR